MRALINVSAVVALALAAFAGAQPASPEQNSEAQPVSPERAADASAMGSPEAIFTGPALVTTVGRADGTIVRLLCQRAGIDAELIEDATSAQLQGVSTLVVAMGGSTKGLGAAGIDAQAELARGQELLAAAASAELPILGVHVGGAPRRGELSDPFCELVASSASALVVKEGGNTDQFFTREAEARAIPLVEVETNGAAIEAINALFE